MTADIILPYVRKSILKDGQVSDSPEIQREAIMRWIEANGYRVSDWFIDVDESGLTENRPEWQRLLKCLHEPDVKGVAVYNYTKTHRNVRDYLTFYDTHIAPHNKILVDVSNPMLDLSTPNGRFMATVFMAGAEHHARVTSQLMKDKVDFVIFQKGRHFGATPFGCDRDAITKHLIPTQTGYLYNPLTGDALPFTEEIPHSYEVRLFYNSLYTVFSLHTSGSNSLSDTANQANKAGWLDWDKDHKTPKEWTRLAVFSVLRRWQLYAGELPPPFDSGTSRYRNRPVLPGGHEPILPIELCNQVSEVMRSRHQIRTGIHAPKSDDYIYILSGLLACDRCGQRLGGQNAAGRGSGRYYRHMYAKGDCQEKMVGIRTLENTVIEALIEVVQIVPLLKNVLSKIKQALVMSSENGDASYRLQQKQAELDRLIDLRQDGLISKEQFIARQQPILAEIEAVKKEIGSTTGSVDVGYIANEIMCHLMDLPHKSRRDQKSLLQKFLSQIRVYDGQIATITPQPWAIPFFETCKLLPEVYPIQQFTHLDLFRVEYSDTETL